MNVDARHDICESFKYTERFKGSHSDPLNINKLFNVVKMLRKNRNVDESCNPLTGGVDLNRNYGFKWGIDNEGSNPNPCSQSYRGKGPFSEPETQAIRNWFAGNIRECFNTS